MKEKKEIKKVKCLTCRETVEVKLIPYGTKEGHIAVCPKCDKLAYNG